MLVLQQQVKQLLQHQQQIITLLLNQQQQAQQQQGRWVEFRQDQDKRWQEWVMLTKNEK